MIDASDDDLIAEVQRRLDQSRFGYHGLMARNQRDYRDLWGALYRYLRERENEDFERWHPMVKIMNDLVNTALPESAVFALATTRYGREHLDGQ